MIHSIKGSTAALRNYCASHYNSKKDLIIDNSDEFVISYSIIRTIIPKLRGIIENETIDNLLYENRITISNIFQNMEDCLTTLEKRDVIYEGAQLESNVTHTRVAEAKTINILADIIYELTKNEGFKIVIPNFCFLDEGSLHIIKRLYQRPLEELPDLVIGYDDSLKVKYNDETGVYWFYSLNKTDSQAFYYVFEEKADKILKLEEEVSNVDYTIQDVESSLDSLDRAIELQGYKLVKENKTFNSKEINIVYNAICKCFNLFNFPRALELAQDAIAKNIQFSDIQKAEIHTIIGVAAHNLHFFSQGNIKLADYILSNYMIAIQFENDSARRICLFYRIVVVMARRKGEIENSVPYLNKAYEELENNNFKSDNARASVYSWICNIHSFVLMRQGDAVKGIKVHEDAFYVLKATKNQGHLAFDLNFSQGVLAENLCTLNAIAGDYEKAKFWYATEEEIIKDWDYVSITSFAEWQSYYFRTLQIDKALEQAKKGVVATKEKYNYILEYFFTMSLGDLNYRLGNAAETIKHYERALEFESKIDLQYTSELSLRKGKLVAMLQLEHYKDFIAYANELITTYKDKESTYNICSLYALKSIAYAKLNEEENANTEINTAIELAISKGEQNVLFHVATQAGHTNLALGKKEEAFGAFNQALEIGEGSLENNVISNTDKALVYIGICSSAPKVENEYLDKAIKSTYLSLKEDASIWWHLNNLITIINANNYNSEQTKVELAGVVKAVKQRVDFNMELANEVLEKA